MSSSDESVIEEVDFNKFRKIYESDEHWKLRKAFMEAHWGKFSEDELLCYAQVFVNVEFLGCRYPSETMTQVALLAHEISSIQKYRAERRNRLKRTFVGAQDAVQAKLKKTTAPRKLDTQETTTNLPKTPSIQLNEEQKSDNLRNLLKNVIFFDTTEGGANGSLNKTTAMMQQLGKLETKFTAADKKFFYIFNDQIIGEGTGENRKTAKKQADEELIATLKANCYTIRSKLQFYTVENVIKPHEQNESAASNNAKSSQLQENNLGFKMLKMLGWKGGSLGTKGEGIVDPINCEIKIGRGGLGADNSESFNKNYIRNLLKNFKSNQVEYDLVFSSEFSKEERALIHQLAQSLDLRTKSYGKNNERHIVISTKLSPQMLRQKLLEGDDYLLEKYEIFPPGSR